MHSEGINGQFEDSPTAALVGDVMWDEWKEGGQGKRECVKAERGIRIMSGCVCVCIGLHVGFMMCVERVAAELRKLTVIFVAQTKTEGRSIAPQETPSNIWNEGTG